MALVAELEWGGSNLVFYNAHLEGQASDQDRAQQMSEILNDLWLRYPPETPAIIAGDFNTKEGSRSAVIRLLRAAAFSGVLATAPGPLYTLPKSEQRLDWIFVRDLQSNDARTHPLEVSGHFPITSTISMVRNAEARPDRFLAKEVYRVGEKYES